MAPMLFQSVLPSTGIVSYYIQVLHGLFIDLRFYEHENVSFAEILFKLVTL
jgi:hypothetical protein